MYSSLHEWAQQVNAAMLSLRDTFPQGDANLATLEELSANYRLMQALPEAENEDPRMAYCRANFEGFSDAEYREFIRWADNRHLSILDGDCYMFISQDDEDHRPVFWEGNKVVADAFERWCKEHGGTYDASYAYEVKDTELAGLQVGSGVRVVAVVLKHTCLRATYVRDYDRLMQIATDAGIDKLQAHKDFVNERGTIPEDVRVKGYGYWFPHETLRGTRDTWFSRARSRATRQAMRQCVPWLGRVGRNDGVQIDANALPGIAEEVLDWRDELNKEDRKQRNRKALGRTTSNDALI